MSALFVYYRYFCVVSDINHALQRARLGARLSYRGSADHSSSARVPHARSLRLSEAEESRGRLAGLDLTGEAGPGRALISI